MTKKRIRILYTADGEMLEYDKKHEIENIQYLDTLKVASRILSKIKEDNNHSDVRLNILMVMDG